MTAMRWCASWLLVLVAAFPPAAASEADQRVVLVLRTGARVTGVIATGGFDEARGVTLRRDDNGGMLTVRWDQMREEDVSRIKALYGFTGDEIVPVQVQAVRVVTPNGELIGLDGGHEEGNLLLRRRENVIRVPLDSIRKIDTVLVDALEVEDPTVLFERRIAETDPTTAVQWYNLALEAEGLTLYDRAKECLDECLEIEPGFSKRDQIEQRKKLLDVKVEEREQTAMLLRIQSLKLRGSFEEALLLAQTFQQQFPSSRQLSAVQREMADVASRRRESLLRKIRGDFHSFLDRACDAKATDRELPLGEAMTWAKETAYGEVIEKLIAYYGIPEAEVLDLWQNRGAEGSPQTASYGGGTFILGEDAKKGLDETEKPDPAQTEDKEEKGLQERIQEKLKEKQKQSEARRNEKENKESIADVPPTPDEWWAGAAPQERSSFLKAFFAEQAGQVTILRLGSRDCSTCGGKGILEFFAVNRVQGNTSGEEPCPRCKMLSFDRMVSYR